MNEIAEWGNAGPARRENAEDVARDWIGNSGNSGAQLRVGGQLGWAPCIFRRVKE